MTSRIAKLLQKYKSTNESRTNNLEDYSLDNGFLHTDDINTFGQITTQLDKKKNEHENLVVDNEDIFREVYNKLKTSSRNT